VTRRSPDREAGAPPGLVIHDHGSASTELPVLSRLDLGLAARLVAMVAWSCRRIAGIVDAGESADTRVPLEGAA
jgi:hypothetical protein